MRYTVLILLCVVYSVSAGQSPLPELKRKAQSGFMLQKSVSSPGALVTSVDQYSPAAKAGLRAGDVVLAINDITLTDRFVMLGEIRRLKAGKAVKLTIRRAGGINISVIHFAPLPAPPETFDNVIVEPIALTNDYGDKLRAFVTKPKSSTGKLPAILFVSWLSCASVETTDISDSWSLMLRDVAQKSGALMLRLEKPGVGDSEGVSCSECDLQRELNGYEMALRYLMQRTDVDTTNIIIFGGSLGGTLGPQVGRSHPIKAYITAVSVYKTWLEHMVELERRRLVLSGKTQAEATALMPGFIDFHSDYLIHGKTPEQVITSKPEWSGLWYDDKTHQYGRPASFYHQLQQLNFFDSWQKVNVPVLIVTGEYDWIMGQEDGQLLKQVISTNYPDHATLLMGKGMNHHWSNFKTPLEAFREEGGTYAQETVQQMIDWIRKVLAN